MLRRPLSDTKKIRSKSIYTKRAMKIPLPRSRVSAIGIRRLTREEMAEARAVSRMLADNGVTVVSGLAAGIDTASHQTAIASEDRTAAVLGTPLNRTYPAPSYSLQRDIMRNRPAVS